MKQCSKCKQDKPLDEFSRNRARKDGRHNYCKECMHAYARTEQYRAANRKRKRSEHGHAITREYRASQRGREAQALARQSWDLVNKDKRKGHRKVRWAVHTGKLPSISSQKCERCSEQATAYHHGDYGRALDVTPLCHDCHAYVHRVG